MLLTRDEVQLRGGWLLELNHPVVLVAVCDHVGELSGSFIELHPVDRELACRKVIEIP
jgi:hypothetical protein